MLNKKVERLQNGESFWTSEKGNSMTPLLNNKQKHFLEPVNDLKDVSIGDIVYCKVRGKLFTHLVKKIDDNKGVLIGNNHGKINGWTKKVYGIVTKIF